MCVFRNRINRNLEKWKNQQMLYRRTILKLNNYQQNFHTSIGDKLVDPAIAIFEHIVAQPGFKLLEKFSYEIGNLKKNGNDPGEIKMCQK